MTNRVSPTKEVTNRIGSSKRKRREKIVIGRIKKWFSDKISICKGDSEIVMLFVSNRYHEVIKDYICHGKEV